MRAKKKIGRIAKGEEVIVDMVEENIIDLFDKLQDVKEDYNRAMEIYGEDKNQDNAKALHYADFAATKAKHELWTAVHTRYGHWDCSVGIRDGYALVKIGNDRIGDMPGFLKRMIEDIKGKMEGEE